MKFQTAAEAIAQGPAKGQTRGDLFTLHAGQLNPTTFAGSGAEYFEPGQGSLTVIAHRDGTHVKVISSYGDCPSVPSDIGARAVQRKQHHNSADTTKDVFIVGYVAPDGTHYGYVPAKAVPFFVFK